MKPIHGLVWHDLRAMFGTRLGEAGFNAFTTAALMGHSNVRTVIRKLRHREESIKS
jgi:integrase